MAQRLTPFSCRPGVFVITPQYYGREETALRQLSKGWIFFGAVRTTGDSLVPPAACHKEKRCPASASAITRHPHLRHLRRKCRVCFLPRSPRTRY